MSFASDKNVQKKANGAANGHAFNEWLERFSRRVTAWSGSSLAFALATLTIIIWAATGPIFHYSDTWQLVINTGTTIVTFLMVFLIQNAQNRESKAIHLKLDELILSMREAGNELIDVEHLTQEQLDSLAERYTKVAEAVQR
jgi:low affinity Fe/Cu permease